MYLPNRKAFVNTTDLDLRSSNPELALALLKASVSFSKERAIKTQEVVDIKSEETSYINNRNRLVCNFIGRVFTARCYSYDQQRDGT